MKLNRILHNKFSIRIHRVLARLYRRIVPVPLSAEQRDFVKANAAFWRSYFKGDKTKKNNGYIFVRVERHPILQFCNASFSTIAAQAKDLRLLFLVDSSVDKVIPILKSYPNASLIFLDSWRCAMMRIQARVAAAKAYHSIRSPQELLDFRVDGMRFGDVFYDEVLAKGYATVDKIDRRTLLVLREFYFLRLFIKNIIKKYDIHTSIFAHTIGLQGAAFSRYLLKYEIEVISRSGSHQILLKKYHTLKDAGVYPATPELKYFNLMMDKDDGTILKLAEEYLERRFNQEIKHPATDIAFSRKKETYTDRQSFCSEYNLDHTKPMAFVMLQAFNDYPHSHFKKSMLFQDYYHWFLRTLEIAQTVESVNWIFKEHPAAEYYLTKDVSLKAIFEQVKSDHIRFLHSKANFNASSLRYLADAILTCIGTAGLEYSTFGIPCILGGEGTYSGFGFTIEPADAAEYEACLRHIDQLPRLNENQIKASKIVGYFYFCVMESAKYYFCPFFDDNQIFKWNEVNEHRMWKEAAAKFLDRQHVEKMRNQVEELSHFVCDNSWSQYIDLRKFGFLDNGAISQVV